MIARMHVRVHVHMPVLVHMEVAVLGMADGKQLMVIDGVPTAAGAEAMAPEESAVDFWVGFWAVFGTFGLTRSILCAAWGWASGCWLLELGAKTSEPAGLFLRLEGQQQLLQLYRLQLGCNRLRLGLNWRLLHCDWQW